MSRKEVQQEIERMGKPLRYIEYRRPFGSKSNSYEIIQLFYTPDASEEDIWRLEDQLVQAGEEGFIGSVMVAEQAFAETNQLEAKRTIHPTGTIEITYYEDNEPLRIVGTRGDVVRLEFKADDYETLDLATVVWDPITDGVAYAILGQDQDYTNEMKGETEAVIKAIFADSNRLQNVIEKALLLGLIENSEEVERLIKREKTGDVIRLEELMRQTAKEYGWYSFFATDEEYQEAINEGFMVDQKYYEAQQSMGVLQFDFDEDAEVIGLRLIIYSNLDEYYAGKPGREETPTKEGVDYFGDLYKVGAGVSEDEAVFMVERQNNSTKKVRFPMIISAGATAVINDINSFAWLNFPWVRRTQLERSVSPEE